jgi:hypothetical protein
MRRPKRTKSVAVPPHRYGVYGVDLSRYVWNICCALAAAISYSSTYPSPSAHLPRFHAPGFHQRTRPYLVVCAVTAAKGVSGSGESIVASLHSVVRVSLCVRGLVTVFVDMGEACSCLHRAKMLRRRVKKSSCPRSRTAGLGLRSSPVALGRMQRRAETGMVVFGGLAAFTEVPMLST